jgi:hypothetical protein
VTPIAVSQPPFTTSEFSRKLVRLMTPTRIAIKGIDRRVNAFTGVTLAAITDRPFLAESTPARTSAFYPKSDARPTRSGDRAISIGGKIPGCVSLGRSPALGTSCAMWLDNPPE